MEEINIKDFFNYLKKYIFLIVIAIVIFSSLVVVYDKILKKPMYTTYTTVVLVKSNTSGVANLEGISQSDVLLNQNLVSTYRQIIKSKLVLNQTIDNLNLKYSVSDLSRNVDVKALEDTEIIKISVSDENPERAATIANKISEVFMTEIIKIYKMNNVSIIDRAQTSYEVSNNTFKRDLVIAILLGILLPSSIVFIKFYFDDTIKLSDTLDQELGLPVIAEVLTDKEKDKLIVDKKPNSLTSESIRTLRTNLQFSSVDKETRTLLVTSTLPSEGKSFISSNLAVAFAQAGKRVLLIDCDLRKGRQHKIFSKKNDKGFSNLLVEGYSDDIIQKTKIKGLHLITRGVYTPNPTELLNSKKNSTLVKQLKEIYDIVIFDSAPCRGLADSLILSSLVDKVVLITSEEYTPKTEIKNTKKAIEKVGGEIAGIVVNRVNNKNHQYGYYYGDD